MKTDNYSLEQNSDRVDLIKSLMLSLVLTAFLYELFPLPQLAGGKIYEVFNNRVSLIICALTLWSLFLLLFKFIDYSKRKKTTIRLFDRQISGVLFQDIYASNSLAIIDELNQLIEQNKIKNYHKSPLYRRINQLLNYTSSAPKTENLHNLIKQQSSIEIKRLDSDYTLLQVFAWAIPILGFIGTVMGIGDSVNNFAVFIQTAQSGAEFSGQIRSALGGVTGGLATAFNTTFLALVLVIPVMIITSILQKSEQSDLLRTEEFCLHQILPRIYVRPSDKTASQDFDKHLENLMQLSSTWINQLQPLVHQMSGDLQIVNAQLGGVEPLIKKFTDSLIDEVAHKPVAESSSSSTANASETAATTNRTEDENNN